MKRQRRTLTFDLPPVILSQAAVVGKKEGDGPLGRCFDKIIDTLKMEKESWEREESTYMTQAVTIALTKAHLAPSDIDVVFAGDLLNQSMASTFALKDFDIPIYEQFGACSSMAQTLSLAAIFVDGGAAEKVVATASSHFCTAERQFRMPLEYGGQKNHTSQWTVTGSGAMVVGKEGSGPQIKHVTTGKIVDYGVTDASNMGAAMAPSAADTLLAFFADTGTAPQEYDYIITGDLASIGSELLQKIMINEGVDISKQHIDCGNLIYKEQQINCSGASGCGCSASVMCGYILPKLINKELSSVLFCATGALLSPTTVQQGASICGVSHVVHITAPI